jgi:hypothetical protein
MSTGDSGTESNADLQACLSDVTNLLDELETPWVVIGALAAEHYRASERTTTDADVLAVRSEGLPEALERAGFESRVARDGDEVHLIRARRADGAVDIIIAGTGYQRLAITRAEGTVLSVEDVLVHKLIAWREKDRDDIRSILSTGIVFDDGYVEHWAREWKRKVGGVRRRAGVDVTRGR